MKIVIENVSDGEIIPHNVLLIRGRVDNLDSSLLEGKLKHVHTIIKELIFRLWAMVVCTVLLQTA